MVEVFWKIFSWNVYEKKYICNFIINWKFIAFVGCISYLLITKQKITHITVYGKITNYLLWYAMHFIVRFMSTSHKVWSKKKVIYIIWCANRLSSSEHLESNEQITLWERMLSTISTIARERSIIGIIFLCSWLLP